MQFVVSRYNVILSMYLDRTLFRRNFDSNIDIVILFQLASLGLSICIAPIK